MHTSKMTTGDPEFPNLCNFMTWNKAALRTALEAAWHDIDKLGTINVDLLVALEPFAIYAEVYEGLMPQMSILKCWGTNHPPRELTAKDFQQARTILTKAKGS